MDNRLDRLANAPVAPLLWQYSLPAVVGMLVMTLYNVVDRIFIGQVVGPEAIAGMAVTFPIVNIATAIGVLVGAGSSARISIALGAGSRRHAAAILGNAATLTLINGTVYIALFAWQLTPMLTAFGAGDATLPYARQYMIWVLPGLLLTNITFGLNNILRASGYPRRAMYTMIIGAVVNVALDALLVLGLDMGMAGAAIATDIAMAVSGWFVVSHFMRRDVTLSFSRGTFRLRRDVVAGIVSLGCAPAVVNLASCLINALINRTLQAHGGDMAIGAAGIFVTVTSIMVTIVLGIGMGLQPIIGYNHGAQRHDRARAAYLIAVAASSTICTGGAAAIWLWPAAVASIFTNSGFLIDQTVVCLRSSLWAFGLVGFQVITTTLFQSIGAPVRALLLSLVRQVIFLIPLLLILPDRYGLTGVWLSFPLSDIMATIAAVALIRPVFKGEKDQHAVQNRIFAQKIKNNC